MKSPPLQLNTKTATWFFYSHITHDTFLHSLNILEVFSHIKIAQTKRMKGETFRKCNMKNVFISDLCCVVNVWSDSTLNSLAVFHVTGMGKFMEFLGPFSNVISKECNKLFNLLLERSTKYDKQNRPFNQHKNHHFRFCYLWTEAN